jgi:hypothetical protein
MRAALLLSTVDTPGDGPVRAMMAHNWARAPHLVFHGIWLPGFMYLTGLVSDLLPLWIALRLFNAVLGTATVPLFFATVAPLFGRTAGVIGAALVASLPLHVELSATALTEVSAVFEILAAVALLTRAVHRAGRARWALVVPAVGSLALASMTRYEAWFLLPLFPAYYWLCTGHGRATLGMAAALAAFPAAWTLGNHLHEGQAFLGLAAAIHDRSFAGAGVGTSAWGAGMIMVTRFAARLGWALVAALPLGLALEIRALVACRLSPERRLYLAIVLVALAGAAAFVVLRGETVADRYFLFAFIFAIPIALVPAARPLGRLGRRGRWIAVAAVLIYSLGLPWLTGRLEARWVTSVATPQHIIAFGQWLGHSPWRARPVVFTRIGWQSTYFPYYFPGHSGMTLIVSEWIDDERLRELTRLAQPALLVTQRGDEAYVQRFVEVTGMTVEPGPAVYRQGHVEVYALRPRLDEGAAGRDRRP